MADIITNRDVFEYDIRGLAGAFLGRSGITFSVTEDLPECPGDGVMTIFWGDEDVAVSFAGHRAVRSFDPGSRVLAKSAAGQAIYECLSAYTGIHLPWGILTGIRPTKLATADLENGRTEHEIMEHLQGECLVTPAKARLSIDIARREMALLEGIDLAGTYSLYIGIPFCPSKCLYCSFTSYPLSQYAGLTGKYLDCLEKELDYFAAAFPDKKIVTVYVGGGTPTTLSPEELDRLCGMVTKRFDLSALREFTVEAGRPDSVTAEKLMALKKHPVTRISVNPQTMKQATLDIIGRKHTAEDVVRVFNMARELGFDNINMDLIMGLPDETAEDVKSTLEQISALSPDSLTIHSLALKRTSRLNLERESYEQYRYKNTEEQMDMAAAFASGMGLFPYYLYRQKNMAGNLENVGYAAPGKEGLYNILIMEEKQSIAACGAGAISKLVCGDGRIERAENVKNLEQYTERIDEMIERKKALFGPF